MTTYQCAKLLCCLPTLNSLMLGLLNVSICGRIVIIKCNNLKHWSFLLKDTYYVFFIICNIRLWSPQNVSEEFQLKIPNISFIISFRKCLFRVEAESRYFRVCLFKCKWAGAPRPLFQYRTMPLQLVPHISAKKKQHLFGFDYHVHLHWNQAF